jgi:hypothetical protein
MLATGAVAISMFAVAAVWSAKDAVQWLVQGVSILQTPMLREISQTDLCKHDEMRMQELILIKITEDL